MRRIDWKLLDRTLGGDASTDEADALEARARASAESAGALDGLRRAGDAPDAPPVESWDVESALARVKRPAVVSKPLPLPRRSRRAIVLGAAAAIAAALAIAAVLRVRANAEPELDGDSHVVTAGVTARGQRLRVNLVDGTQVVLAPESRLSVGRTFERGSRAVVVEGEAYFRVAHDSARPFRLRAGAGIVEVLGTEFTVRAYPGDATVRVVVVSGRVGFRAAALARRVILERGDVAELAVRDSVGVTHTADPAAYLEWVSGRLDFENVPLGEVARRLERWYDVRISIADSLATRRVDASFRDPTLRDVLRSLCPGLRVRCVQEGRDVRIEAEAR